MNTPFIIVGVVGMPGAGKTTATSYLQKKGFIRIILSDFIKEELVRKGVEVIDRVALQNYGNKMRRDKGPQILAELAYKRIRKNKEKEKKGVIDGIRNAYEIEYLKKKGNFYLIGITAIAQSRYTRLKTRKIRPITCKYREFLAQEKRELTLGTNTYGLRVKDCLKKADYKVINNGTTRNLYKQIDEILDSIEITI